MADATGAIASAVTVPGPNVQSSRPQSQMRPLMSPLALKSALATARCNSPHEQQQQQQQQHHSPLVQAHVVAASSSGPALSTLAALPAVAPLAPMYDKPEGRSQTVDKDPSLDSFRQGFLEAR